MPSPQHNKVPLFPPNFTQLARMRIQEVFGIIIVTIAILSIFALWTYSPLDSSLNTVNYYERPHILKYYIAITADILKQILGGVSWVFVFSLLILGLKVCMHYKNTLSLKKIIFFLLSLTLLSISFQSLFIHQVTSPILISPIPYGGAIGLFLSQKIMIFLNSHHISQAFIPIMVIFFFLFLFLWKYALSLTFKDFYIYTRKIALEFQKFINLLKIIKIPQSQVKTPFHNTNDELNLKEILGDTLSKESFSNQLQQEEITPKSKNPLRNSIGYHFPSINLLTNMKEEYNGNLLNQEKLNESSQKLLSVLSEFGINGDIIHTQPGPIVTMYEFRPAPGIKTSRIISLSDDIARSMSALSARIANIPGKNAIGIELPNEKRQTVYLRSLLNSAAYKQTSCHLPLILGKDISGNPVLADLAKMPHLLVAGTTGSGKSVSINTMILSLLYKFSPEQCRFIMVDPKMLELSVYNDIPHLLTPVVTDPKKAIYALKWAVREMETRYKAMSHLGVRNIDGFNQKIADGHKKGDIFMHRIQTGFDPETGKPIFEDQPLDYKELPFLVIVVDEMADLMLVAGKEIEMAVQRLAQMARAAGIHLIMATQRPSVDVITGTIKANFPTRMSFQVTSKIDSRTILGEQGAEHLLGHGDMLYMSGGGRIQRVHGPFASDDDVESVITFLKSQGDPDYIDGITDEIDDNNSLIPDSLENNSQDELFNRAVDFIRQEGRVSISFIQRNFQIGYNKAAKLVEQMEKEGIVSSPDRSGKRELLLP